MSQINNQEAIWKKVEASRNLKRPQTLDFIENIFDDYLILHGDRKFGDDEAMVGGIGVINQFPITFIGQQKGREVSENVKYRQGMNLPEGYRKALRLMKQAEKFKRPIICFVDTPAAYPNPNSESRGIFEAIASNLMEMSKLKVPILAIVLSQGGSGGALGISVANEIWALENSYYSIIPPEGFAVILLKDGAKKIQAASLMKSSTKELYQAKIIDKVIKEPVEGIAKNPYPIYQEIKKNLQVFLTKYQPGNVVVKKRLAKFNKIKPHFDLKGDSDQKKKG